MSAGFDLVIRRASQEQLWLSSVQSHQSLAFFIIFIINSSLCLQHQLCQGLQAASMRLRSKRTGSGVECFGAFHIHRFLYMFLFFRGALT